MAGRAEIVEHLRVLPCLSSLGYEEIVDISRISRIEEVRRNRILFAETGPVTSLFVVKAGRIKLSKTSSEGRELVLKTLGPGDYFCCAPLLCGGRHLVGAMALEESTLVVIPADRFKEILQRGMSDMGFRVLRGLCGRVQHLSELLENFAFKDVEQRVVELLVRLAAERSPEHGVAYLALTHQDLASMVGSVREVVSRVMARLRRQGVVVEAAAKGFKVHVQALAGLAARYADGGPDPGGGA